MSLKSKDCLEYLEKELKKELIGPSDGLFNRVQYKKVDGKDKIMKLKMWHLYLFFQMNQT